MDIKRIRLSLDLSQQELAVALGVSVTTVSRWERDRNKPHPETVRRVLELVKQKGREK